MSVFSDISLLRPLWLLALPVIIGLAVLARRRQAQPGDWGKAIDLHLMQAMEAMGRVRIPRSGMASQLPIWAAGLICVALVGPAVEGGDAQTFRNLDGVVFVLDVSDSMTQDARWDEIVTVARAGLSGLGSKPAALIVFAGDSYVASTLTTDTRHLGQTMALLSDETVPDKGSRPALALTQAAQILTEAAILAGDVVLITDGGGLGPEALVAAKSIADLGGRLSMVRAETSVSRQQAATRADFESLAEIGGGRLFELSEATELAEELGRGQDKRLERQTYRLLFWTDYGRYLLLLVLIPVAALFRRESV
ncbi:MAG: VWA domain-containing protein [Paracoccaceae bacterium]